MAEQKRNWIDMLMGVMQNMQTNKMQQAQLDASIYGIDKQLEGENRRAIATEYAADKQYEGELERAGATTFGNLMMYKINMDRLDKVEIPESYQRIEDMKTNRELGENERKLGWLGTMANLAKETPDYETYEETIKTLEPFVSKDVYPLLRQNTKSIFDFAKKTSKSSFQSRGGSNTTTEDWRKKFKVPAIMFARKIGAQ